MRPLGSRGSTLVLNLLVMAVFAMMSVIVYKSAKAMVGEAVYYERSAQALSIAEAGVEDALHSLYSTSTWRTGFTQKAFASGYYTVSVATISAISLNVVSTGYSAPLLMGRAVKTVSVTVVFVSSTNPSTAVLSANLTVNGTVDAYDPRVNLSPSTGSFVDGGLVWADQVATGGSCGSVRIKASVIVYNASPPSLSGSSYPGTGCVDTPTETIESTSTHVTLPLHTCNAACQTLAAGYNAQINVQNPVTTPYNAASQALNVTQDQVVNLSSGTYYFATVSVTKGTLNVDTTNGPVYIYYTNSFTMTSNVAHPCAINNLSKWPSSFIIGDVAGSHTVTLNCPTALHAYLEGSSNHFNLSSGSELYGHFSGADATIASGAKLHVDLSEGVPATHLTWSAGSTGSWAENYKRQ